LPSERGTGHHNHDAEGERVSLTQEHLVQLLHAAARRVESIASQTAEICAIPAPTGAETARASYVADQFQSRGYAVEIDDVSNVYAYRGARSSSSLMLLAHTDTVFSADTELAVKRDGNRLFGPAIGDNSLGVAATLAALDVLDELGVTTDYGIRVVANSGEEGLGNLRGAWRAVQRFKDETGAVIAVEGHNLGRVTHVAVGSKRWRVTVTGPGGHSWGAFGEPSAIHGLGRIIAAISRLDVPDEPRTTFNVGLIDGGTSINTIAPRASALIDMRSVSTGALDELAERVGRIIEAETIQGLDVSIEVLGERPAGATGRADPLVEAAARTLRWLGHEPVYDASSTDANVPISLGIPAICVGITSGGRVHTTEEYIDIRPIEQGVAQLSRLCIEATRLVSGSAS
jgi:tripeptide aminopeptidase